MKKVVFLVPSLGMGGMERVLVNYANLFVKRGYDVTVLNFTYDDPGIVDHFDERVHYKKNYAPVKNLFHSSIMDLLHLRFRLLPWSKWAIIHSPKYLYNKYITEYYDIEIAFYGNMSIKIVSGSTNKLAKTVGWIHSVDIDQGMDFFGSIEKAKKIYRGIPKYICVSKESESKFKELISINNGVFCVNNPNDTQRIRLLALKSAGINKDLFTFVMVARFDDHAKGFLRLFDVCKKLNNDGFDYSVWLVGDGNDFDIVKAKATELSLDNITFYGKRANPYPYIYNADMYLCSSYYEGFSMVMMEAIILGKPMLTTDVSGADEMLDGGKYGMIVENSEEGLYKGMKEILTNPKLYQHYCKMADERKDYLDEEKIMDQVEAILEE